MPNPSKYYVAFFVISYRSLDEVKSKEPQSLEAHLARSRELYRHGKVLMAGAFIDRPDEPLNTMGVSHRAKTLKSTSREIHSS
jgi:uncharacterized protein YciI